MSTLGNGDFTAATGAWQVLSVLASINRLIAVTLAITFLVPVASGVVLRRHLAVAIATLGETPRRLLERSWNGTDFSLLESHVERVVSEIGLLTQRHMAYPVVH